MDPKPIAFAGMAGRIELHGRVVNGRYVETVTYPPDLPPKPKKKRRVSPTLRSIWELKKRGAMYAQVWRRVPMAGGNTVTVDLFGFADLLAVDAFPASLAIQATTVANQAAHVEKIALDASVAPRAAKWVGAGNRLELWCWSRVWRVITFTVRGRQVRARRNLWTPSITAVRLTDGHLTFWREGKEVTPWAAKERAKGQTNE